MAIRLCMVWFIMILLRFSSISAYWPSQGQSGYSLTEAGDSRGLDRPQKRARHEYYHYLQYHHYCYYDYYYWVCLGSHFGVGASNDSAFVHGVVHHNFAAFLIY